MLSVGKNGDSQDRDPCSEVEPGHSTLRVHEPGVKLGVEA